MKTCADSQFLRKIGRKIGEVRFQKGYTQLQLAEKANVSIQMVQYWESGRNITLKTLYRLAQHLAHPIGEFLKNPKNSEPQKGRPRRNKVRSKTRKGKANLRLKTPQSR
jgi:transcriptional regulator with XRE-family HTH domain